MCGDFLCSRIQSVERTTKLRDRISTGLKWGRLYGGAAGLILIDGQEDLSQPLDMDAVLPGSFRGLYILDRWQGISPDAALTFEGGELVPASYSISDAAGHTAARVHHSRLVRFTGRELPDLERQAELYWGESEVEALYKDVVAHDNVSANMAALTFQANINTMEVKGLEQLLSLSSPDVQKRFWNTMQAQSVLRSNFGVQLVEQGNKMTNTQYTFGTALMYEGGKVVVMSGTGTTANKFAGVAGSEIKSALSYTDQNTGVYAPGDACSVFQRGSINVLCQRGAPALGGDVYVRIAATADYPAASVGGFEAAADDKTAGNTIKLPNCQWGGAADTNGVAELVILTRANA